MRRSRAALLAISAGLTLGPSFGAAEAATLIECRGTVTILSQSNVEVAHRGQLTVTEFDYTARDTVCLADGSVVDGVQTGHLQLRLGSDGSGTMRFVSTLIYRDGRLLGVGHGWIDQGGTARGVVVASGAGAFAGVTAVGTFRSTSPITFQNTVWYLFP